MKRFSGRQKEISAASYALDLSNPGAVSKTDKTDLFSDERFLCFHCSDPQEPRNRQYDHPVFPGFCKTQDSVTETCILRRSFSGNSGSEYLFLVLTGRMITPWKKAAGTDRIYRCCLP